VKRDRALHWLRRVAWWVFCAAVLGWAFYEAASQPIYDPVTAQ